MSVHRRRLLTSVAAVGLAGLAGCTSESGDDRYRVGSDDDGSTDTDFPDAAVPTATTGPNWEWQGSVPVESGVQYHDPSCGCCSVYVEYLEDAGLEITIEEVDDLDAVKAERNIPEEAQSCHTVEFGEYLLEGHVPLEAIERLFNERPDVDGLTERTMPNNSPGMGPPGETPLTVYTFETDGTVEPFLEVERDT